MFIHANEMRMKTTHHSFFCFTQKCGAEIRKKLRLLFLLESQNGLFPGFWSLVVGLCLFVWKWGCLGSLSGWCGDGGDSVCDEHSLPNRGSVKTMVRLKSFETESLLQVLKTWSKTCAQGLFIWPLHLVREKCGFVHLQWEPVQCTLHMTTAFGVRKMWSCALAMWTSAMHTLDDTRLHECNLDSWVQSHTLMLNIAFLAIPVEILHFLFFHPLHEGFFGVLFFLNKNP